MTVSSLLTAQLPITFVRWKAGEDRVVRVAPSLPPDHPATSSPCIACGEDLGTVEPIALLALGPGSDQQARDRYAGDRWGTFAAVILHAACAGPQR